MIIKKLIHNISMNCHQTTGISISASTGHLEVKGGRKTVLASEPTPLQINHTKLTEELKHKFNFKSKASYGFELKSMTQSMLNEISFKMHYGCFNTSQGRSRSFWSTYTTSDIM